MRPNRRAWSTVVVIVTAMAGALLQPIAAGASPGSPAQIRVNQVGYPAGGPKAAFAMLPRKVARVRFEVVTPYGVAYRGVSADGVGAWNANYQAVYRLSFSGLRREGQYRIRLLPSARGTSPGFVIGDGSRLYRQLVDNSVRYFTSERDGPDVVSSVLSRQPANLTDEKAYVYADPRYDSNDNLLGTLKKTGGPVDVSGGWFDAGGGYEKFAYTASYADALMLLAARVQSNQQGPDSYDMLQQEAAFGLQWITKLWNPARKVLYAQVGIGTGNASNTIQGDYNFWFLPQREDRLNTKPGGKPGPSAYYVKYRPVFPAAPPGQKVSPNLAGRFAADFALGAQLASDPAEAAHLLSLARGVYLFITDALYQEYGGPDPSGQFASFAQQQLNFALGANGWGASFVVGAGTAFPHCMQSEIANLAGSLTGTGTIQLGATTDGPSDPANFTGLSTVDGMRACSAGHFAPFNTKAAAYEDNVISWPSVEPADDYTANSLMAFALGAAGLG
jgi:Glycosyl hydrolase family 9/Cellulase N-terminal ig-like domain